MKDLLKICQLYGVKIQHQKQLEGLIHHEIDKAFEGGQKSQNRGISNWINEGNRNKYGESVDICDCCMKIGTGFMLGTCEDCL